MTFTVERATIRTNSALQRRYEVDGVGLWVELEGLSRTARASVVADVLDDRALTGDVRVVATSPGTYVWVPLSKVEDCLDELVIVLGSAGHTGSITTAPVPNAVVAPYTQGPSLLMAHAIDPPPSMSTFNAFGMPKRRWDVPTQAEERLLRSVTDWLAESPVAFAGSLACLPLTQEDGPDVLRLMIEERLRFQALALTERPDDQVTDRYDPVTQVVQVAPFGVTAWTDLRDRPVVDRVHDLESRLGSFAGDIEVGFISTAAPTGSEIMDLTPTIWGRRRHLWDSWVGDAHAVQLLSRAHLDRAHDLSDWEVEQVADDRWIVRSRDLEAWFADEVSPELLEQARRDFGEMILTDEVAAANSPSAPA